MHAVCCANGQAQTGHYRKSPAVSHSHTTDDNQGRADDSLERFPHLGQGREISSKTQST